MALSNDRAFTVMDYLQAHGIAGCPADQFKGFGPTEPVASNDHARGPRAEPPHGVRDHGALKDLPIGGNQLATSRLHLIASYTGVMKYSIGHSRRDAVFSGQAQIAHGGQPIGWGQGTDRYASAINEVVLDPAWTAGALIATERSNVPGPASGTASSASSAWMCPRQGEWTSTDDGRRVCRLMRAQPRGGHDQRAVRSVRPGPRGRCSISTMKSRSYFIGGFNELNELPTGDMATAVVPGDAVVIELQERIIAPRPASLHISQHHAWLPRHLQLRRAGPVARLSIRATRARPATTT